MLFKNETKIFKYFPFTKILTENRLLQMLEIYNVLESVADIT